MAALDQQVPGCLSEEAGDAIFTGCDVEIRNGLGNTETTNGSGNLIVGYNEGDTSSQTGSHNMVGGTNSEYTSYGGLVVGFANSIYSPYATGQWWVRQHGHGHLRQHQRRIRPSRRGHGLQHQWWRTQHGQRGLLQCRRRELGHVERSR